MFLTVLWHGFNAAHRVIKIGCGRTKLLLTTLAVNTLCKGWNPLFTMSSGVVNNYISLSLGTVVAAGTAEADAHIRILSALRNSIVWMTVGHVLEIRGTLDKFATLAFTQITDILIIL